MLEYLRSATPRFHIDGRHVMLDYSTPQGGARRPRSAAPTQSSSSNSAINAAVQVAEAAIQAAHWSRGEKVRSLRSRFFYVCSLLNLNYRLLLRYI